MLLAPAVPPEQRVLGAVVEVLLVLVAMVKVLLQLVVVQTVMKEPHTLVVERQVQQGLAGVERQLEVLQEEQAWAVSRLEASVC